MIRRTLLIAGATLGIVGASLIAAPAEAGTCAPVAGKARAADPATATTRAQIEMLQRAARFGGKISQTSTNCKKSAGGYVCKMTAVVCPRKS